MYFMQKSNVMFRDYESFGYLTDNRNFGYSKVGSSVDNDIGDKIVSSSGVVFLSALSNKPQKLEELALIISEKFDGVSAESIIDDAKEFYSLLEADGFIVSGRTQQECKEKDFRFSYKDTAPGSENEHCLSTGKTQTSTQEFFDEYLNGRFQLTNVHIEITSKCNERCLHCYIPHEDKLNHIDPDVFYSILEQCRKMNVLHLTLSGGEPMLHNNFCDFLRKCREYNFSVNVLSNLTLLDDLILEEMKRNPLLSAQVSLYSMEPSVHDSITQMQGSFEKTQNAILKLLENDIPLQISCPIMEQNINCYNDVLTWGNRHSLYVACDHTIIASYNHTTQNLLSRLSLDDLESYFEQKIADEPDYLYQLEKDIEQKRNTDPDDAICSVCFSTICITECGNVYPCVGWQDYVVGNINDTPLIDIWNSSEKVQYLRNLRKRDFSKCINCQEKEFCTMCMVRNANEDPFGNPLAVNDYYCQIAKMSKRMFFEKKRSLVGSHDNV